MGYNDAESLFEDFRQHETERKNEAEKRKYNLKAATIIKNMLKDKLPTDLIKKYTGLTEDQLNRIDKDECTCLRMR
ncbi:MAG: hypothetical protein GY749_29830 [Desulfobacteraceae bacterium]|nr:hypothetical protein [Desulfobacteraceae bacterium]